jgi:hypothetical protein
MSGTELANHLRLLSGYHLGTDLVDRLTAAERFQRQQRDALVTAADHIEALMARNIELERMLADDGELPASAVPGLR